MILTKDQHMTVKILEEFGALKEKQVEFLLRQEYSWTQPEKAYSFLQMNGLVKRFGGVISLPDKSPDMKTVDAVDIMIEVSSNALVQYQKGAEPFLVTFFKEKDKKLWRYDICNVVFGTEIMLNAALENLNLKFRKIIFLIEREEQIPALFVNGECCFVIKRADKFHYFSKGE